MILSGYTIEVYGCEKGTQLQIAAILTKMAKYYKTSTSLGRANICGMHDIFKKRNRQDVSNTCKDQRFFCLYHRIVVIPGQG